MAGTAARRGSGMAVAVLVAAVAGCTSSSVTSGRGAPSAAGSSSSKAQSGSSPASTPPAPGASHLAGFDLKRNQIDVFDAQLKIVRHISIPAMPSPFPHVGPGDTFVFTSTNGNAVIDLHSGKATPFTLPSTDEFQQYAPDDAKVLTFADTSGRVSVLNLASGSVTDGRTLAGDPNATFLSTAVAFHDGITFTSISGADTTTLVVPYDGSAAYAVRGRVLSLTNGAALSAELTGTNASRIAVRTGTTDQGSLTVDGRVEGGLLTGPTTATVVTDDGRVLSADLAHGTTNPLAALGGTSQVAVEVSADRLLVGNPGNPETTRLVDAQGHVVASFPPVGGQAVWIGFGYLPVGSRCFVTQAGSKPVVSGGGVSLRDAETGSVRARLSGSAILVPTPDGCTAVSNLSVHAQAALDGTVHTFPPFSTVAAVSPDLKYVVATGRGRPGDATGWAAVDVMTGRPTPVPAGVYTWVTGAAA